MTGLEALPEPPRFEPAFRSSNGLVRLAANELPYSPPASVHAAVLAYAPINRYADPDATALWSAVAEDLQVPRECVLLGAGSSVLLQRMIRVLCPHEGDAVMWVTPGFDAIELFARQAGATAQHVPLAGDGSMNLTAILEAITDQTRMILLVSPHNPTGAVIHAAELRGFLDQVPDDVVVVLDEAYMEFCDDPACADGVELAKGRWAAGHHGIAVTRTMSKAYGLAGLRIGYGIAPPDLARAVRDAGMPRELGSLAQHAALAALKAKTAMRKNAAVVIRERARVATELRRYGFAPPPSRGNFVWLPLGDDTGAFVEHCRTHGVQILGVPDLGARITIGTTADNTAFLRVAQTWATGSAVA